MAEQTYTLGGFEVYDVDGVPHYSSTKTKLKTDKTGKPISPFYELGGVSVYDVDGVPHYKETGEKLQHSSNGTPIKPTADTPIETPQTTPPVSEADDKDKGETRTNSNGITQRGMTLGGIKQFGEKYGLKVADGASLFSLGESTYGSRVTGPDNKPMKMETHVWSEEAGGLVPPSTPGVTGKDGKNPTSGVSKSPDYADTSRSVSFDSDEPSDESLVSPMYRDKARNAYRAAFLSSTGKGPMAVLREASAAQGVIRTNDGKISIKDGDGYRTYTGDKSAREVAFDLAGGQGGYEKHAANFNPISPPDKPEIKSDDEQTPATPWSGMSMDEKKGAVNAFAQDFADNFKDKLKKKD